MRPRILYAENDLDFRATRVEFLQPYYEVLEAGTLAETEDILLNETIHLAILDVRMIRDDDESDRSGIELAWNPAFRHIPKIILTSFPSFEDVRELLKPISDRLPLAVDYLTKAEGASAMVEAVHRAFENYVNVNWDLIIRWCQPLSFPTVVNTLESDLSLKELEVRIPEMEDLFRRLFTSYSQIVVESILSATADRIIMQATTFSGIGQASGLIIDCALREMVTDELSRFGEIEKILADNNGIYDVIEEESSHYSLAVYKLKSCKLWETKTFPKFFQASSIEDIYTALNNLYGNKLGRWHKTESVSEEKLSTREFIHDGLGINSRSLARGTIVTKADAIAKQVVANSLLYRCEFETGSLTINFPDRSSATFRDPTQHLYSYTINQPTRYALTNGRLKENNLLVDPVGNVWFIDFSDIRPGPILRDFLSLESSIRFDVLGVVDLRERYAIEEQLMRLGDRDGNYIVDSANTLEVTKCLMAIEHIRNFARKHIEVNEDLYNLGLLYVTLDRLSNFDPKILYTRHELVKYAHALLLAAMLADQLSRIINIPDDLPEQALTGLWLDPKNKEVWVEGRLVELTPQEFAILNYLNEHEGQVCTRESIIEGALLEEEGATSNEAGRLNSAMSRLRAKVEPDPESPRFLLTKRGYGYSLDS